MVIDWRKVQAHARPWAWHPALSTRRFLSIAFLPVNHLLLFVGKVDLVALFTCQFCPPHIRFSEIASLEMGAAKICVTQVSPYEIDPAEN